MIKLKKLLLENEPESDEDAFMAHHYTGHISSDAYSNSEKEGGLSWLGNKSKYPILLHRGKYKNFDVEFRQIGEKNKFVKWDANKDIVRDEDGMAMYMSDDEAVAEGYPLYGQLHTTLKRRCLPEFKSDDWLVDNSLSIRLPQGNELE